MSGIKTKKPEPVQPENSGKQTVRGLTVFRRGIVGDVLKMLTLVLTAAIILWTIGSFFHVRQITVEGNEGYSDEEILQSSGLKTGDSMLLLNVSRARKKLLAENRYLASVKIRRSYPSSVTIEVTEYSEDYAIAINGAFWITDHTGVLLELRLNSGDAVVVQGAVMSEAAEGSVFTCADFAKDTLLKIAFEALEQNGLQKRVTLIDVSQSYRPVITVDGKYDFILGSVSEAETMIARIPLLLEIAEADGMAYGTFDLTDTDVRCSPERVDLNGN